jgi:hypothetical protein
LRRKGDLYHDTNSEPDFFSACGSMDAITAPSPSIKPAIYARCATESIFPTGLTFLPSTWLLYLGPANCTFARYH